MNSKAAILARAKELGITYENSATGDGLNDRVKIHGKWVYCPSHELMYEQAEHRGFKRGSRVTNEIFGDGTVLSVYRVRGTARACVMFDGRDDKYKRQGMPIDGQLRLIK